VTSQSRDTRSAVEVETAAETRRPADFTRFFETEYPGQKRRAAMLVGDTAAAEDIVHDAFVAVWSRWDGLDAPGPYLSRCVLNGCRDLAARRRSRRSRLLALGDRAVPEGPVEILTDVLSRLPFPQRCALVLRYYGGLTTHEIAEVMECPPGSVGPWIERAKARLRKELS
jgi:RNA polymerase sigma factor (sigma-70 family)